MRIEKICESYPHMYICVKNCRYDKKNPNLLSSATPFFIYPTLQQVKNDKQRLLEMLQSNMDFDIIYGDYADYINTRKDKKVVLRKNDKKLTQHDIDILIANIK